MLTVSFAANLRGRAGSAASLSSGVIPSEVSNPRFAASPAEPSNAAAPIPPAACRINSLRFITPPFFNACPFHYTLLDAPHCRSVINTAVSRLTILRRANATLADSYDAPGNRRQVRHTAPALPFRTRGHQAG